MFHMNLRGMFITLVFGSALTLASFTVASAAGPTSEGPLHFEGSFVLGDCGSFQIIDNWDADLTALRFHDEAGQVERVIFQQQGTDTFTNSVTGKAYSGSYHNTTIFDLRQLGTGQIYAGIVYHVTVPGIGAAVLDVGLVRNLLIHSDYIRLAGPHQVLEDSDLTGLCVALA